MVDPVVVAERYCHATGFMFAHPWRVWEERRQNIVFDVVPGSMVMDPDAEYGVVNVNGPCPHIGYREPGEGRWMIYPECVFPEEQDEVAALLEDLASVSHAQRRIEAEMGEPFVDLRDPVTIEVRRQMNELIRSSGLLETLIGRKAYEGRSWVVDEATTARFGLSTKVKGVRGL